MEYIHLFPCHFVISLVKVFLTPIWWYHAIHVITKIPFGQLIILTNNTFLYCSSILVLSWKILCIFLSGMCLSTPYQRKVAGTIFPQALCQRHVEFLLYSHALLFLLHFIRENLTFAVVFSLSTFHVSI